MDSLITSLRVKGQRTVARDTLTYVASILGSYAHLPHCMALAWNHGSDTVRHMASNEMYGVRFFFHDTMYVTKLTLGPTWELQGEVFFYKTPDYLQL